MAATPNCQLVELKPHLIARRIGGWLAVTPPDSGWSFGVEGATRMKAEAAFYEAVSRWERIGNRPLKGIGPL